MKVAAVTWTLIGALIVAAEGDWKREWRDCMAKSGFNQEETDSTEKFVEIFSNDDVQDLMRYLFEKHPQMKHKFHRIFECSRGKNEHVACPSEPPSMEDPQQPFCSKPQTNEKPQNWRKLWENCKTDVTFTDKETEAMKNFAQYINNDDSPAEEFQEAKNQLFEVDHVELKAKFLKIFRCTLEAYEWRKVDESIDWAKIQEHVATLSKIPAVNPDHSIFILLLYHTFLAVNGHGMGFSFLPY